MLPPTSTRRPAASSIRPTSVVVVDLPLVPVMATTRPAQPARGQLQLADHRHAAAARAATSSGSSSGTPGLITTRSARVERAAASCVAELERHAGRSQRVARRQSPASRSVSVTCAPRRTSSSRGRHAAAGGADDDQHALALHGERRAWPSSSQLQRRQAEEREDDRDDHEARDHLRLLPADQLEVVVQRRHPEHPLARSA